MMARPVAICGAIDTMKKVGAAILVIVLKKSFALSEGGIKAVKYQGKAMACKWSDVFYHMYYVDIATLS